MLSVLTEGIEVSIVNAKQMLMKASVERCAVGAFNVTNLIQMKAVVEAATERNSPLIVQTSTTPTKLLGADVLVSIYRTTAVAASIPICLHLDHITDVDYCKTGIDAGYTNVMIDASQQGFEENVKRTKEVCDYAHRTGDVSVEGELGTVSGVEDQIKVVGDEAQLCDPESSKTFVERTGVDVFGPAIGTAHGVYKSNNPNVDFDRFKEIWEILNGDGITVPLVIHGGTGLPADTVRRLIELGGSKFNVSTDLKHTLLDTTFEYLSENREEYNPGRVDEAVKAATMEKVGEWIDLLGCAGKA